MRAKKKIKDSQLILIDYSKSYPGILLEERTSLKGVPKTGDLHVNMKKFLSQIMIPEDIQKILCTSFNRQRGTTKVQETNQQQEATRVKIANYPSI